MKPEGPIVYLVGGGPGDPALITLRGIQCLRMADVVVYDRLVHPSLLAYASLAEKIDVGKRPRHHPVPQAEINALLLRKAGEGKIVVRLKGGDPFLFGRGGEEALSLRAAGIPFEVVPGISSGLAVPAYAGIPVTQRDLSTSVVFLTAHRSAGCPDALCIPPGADTYVFFMGVERMPEIVSALLAQGMAPDTPAAVIQQGTTPAQMTVSGVLGDILSLSSGIRPPALVVVGRVAGLHKELAWFESPRRALFGLRVLNTRPIREGLHHVPSAEDAFAVGLMEAGAEAISLPVTRLVPIEDPTDLDAAIAGMTDYDDLVFTSANGVDYFFERFFTLDCDLRRLGGLRIAVLGKTTAQSLAGLHLMADFVPSASNGKALGEELPDVSGRRILLPASARALEDAPDALRKHGALVDVLPVYDVQPGIAQPPVLEVLQEGKLDVVTFFSPSAVEGLLQILDTITIKDTVLRSLPAACIGETTARAARQAGFDVQVVAEEQTTTGAVQALVAWRANRSES